jgi:nucleoside-diphosphate-sugar epimerase
MPRVLLTGSSGGVGRAAQPALQAAGWEVQPFDLADGQDLRDPRAVEGAMQGSESAELGSFVHVDDVAAATVRALAVDMEGHHRLTLCGAGPFDCTRARTALGWTATRTWAERLPPQPGI